MFNLDDCIGIITNRVAKSLSKAFGKRLEERGITRTQWIAIYYIGEMKGITQKELAEKMSATEASTARLVDRLEKNELVIRRKDSEDRRITKLTLTDKGKHFREDLIPLGEQFSNDITRGISEEELEIYKNVLGKMIQNIE